MTPITFHVDGEPKAQPRPRAFAMGGRARMYNPATAEGWKSCVADGARRHIPREPITLPVAVEVTFWMPRPKNHYGSGRNAQQLKPGSPFYHVAKPDGDNLIKAVLDALTTLRVWHDDSLVVDTRVVKRYANGRPGADITITPLANEQLQLSQAG